MQFTLKVQGSIQNMMRQAGYYLERTEGEELVFVRPLSASRSGYPRFHIYLKVSRETQGAIVNLHLDQKKPSYGGVAAHSGEYDGELISREAERIKNAMDS